MNHAEIRAARKAGDSPWEILAALVADTAPAELRHFLADVYGAPGVRSERRAYPRARVSGIVLELPSAAGDEMRDPQRDVPIGLIGALVICTVFYLLVAAGAGKDRRCFLGLDCAVTVDSS